MTHKLTPMTGKPFLSPEEVVRRLRDEFEIADVDAEEGRDQAQNMLLQLIKMQQGGLSGCEEKIERTQKVQADALMVTVSDEPQSENALLRFLLIPDSEIIVTYYSGEHQRLAEPLLKRCSEVLGYPISWA